MARDIPERPHEAGETRPQVPPAAGSTGAGQVPTARSQRLLTLSREGGNGAAVETPRDPAAASPGQGKQANMVMVWPQLVSIEFVAILVFTAMLLVLGTVVNAPLDLLANPDRTPNPSKAPWYFLNLQELLLHMHPTLAGVLVPGGALALLAAIPYIDNTPAGTGRWFTTPAGKAITIFSMIYATVLNTVMIFIDEYISVRRIIQDLLGLPKVIVEVIIPISAMFGLSYLLVWYVQRRWGADTRHWMIALFSGFFATFIILTIFGTAFRGPGMQLFWPWDTAGRSH
jgi:menaquinol-cytochrome c reductase cytochrome b/c subunit